VIVSIKDTGTSLDYFQDLHQYHLMELD